MSRKDDIKSLIARYNRNLQKLKEKKASFGLHTPSHILTEIEDIEAEIEELQLELNGENAAEMTSPITPSNTNIKHEKTEAPKGTLWIPQVWWVPIIVASIGLIGVVVLLFMTNSGQPPSLQSFTYLVRVQQMGTSQTVSNAKVTLEVSGQAPLDEITDSNGVARIFVNDAYSGQPGRLLIEAVGYEAYRQEIDLTEGGLPDTVRLNSLPPTPTITHSPTNPPPTPTNTALPTNTSTPTDMPPSIPPTTTPTATATDTPIPTATPTAPTQPTNTPAVSVEIDDYLLKAQPCQFLGQILSCSIAITNLEPVDRQIRMMNGGDASLWDDSGVEHRSTYVEIGGATNRDLYNGVRFLPDTTVQAEFQFDGVDPGTKIVKLLEIRTMFTNDLVFQLRDIPVAGATDGPGSKALPETVVSTIVDDYFVGAEECRLVNQMVVCDLLIINQAGYDRTLRMRNGGDAIIIDSQGIEHESSKVEVGQAVGRKLYEGVRFLAGVPVRAEFTFDGVSPEVGAVQLLEIRTMFTQDLLFQLRNIPISK